MDSERNTPAAEDNSQDTVQPETAETEPGVETENNEAASSSDADDKGEEGESRETLLDAVSKVVEKPDAEDKEAEPSDRDKSDTQDASEEGKEGKEEGEEADDLPDEPDEEELQSYKPRTRRRVEKLLGQRRELLEENKSLQEEVQPARELNQFLQENDVSNDDMNLMMGLAAALRKGEFDTFLKGVAPYVEVAQQQLGYALPQDLQQQVDDGTISREHAQELQRSRAEAERLRANEARRQQTDQQTQQERQVQDVRTAIDQWEQNVKQRDADYSQKSDLVRRYSQALIQEHGAPQSAQEAIELVEQAYKEASDYLRKLQPPRKPTPPKPSGSGQSSTNARAEPRSVMEAAQQALERSRESA